jgi:hypothetical protein
VLSIIFKGASSVSISTDGKTETVFQFEEPVYIEGNREYAVVVTSNAKANSYQLWTSELGAFIAGSTTARVKSDVLSGVFFKSQNGVNWTTDQTKDLTYNLYRAKFLYQTTVTRLKSAPPPVKLLDSDPLLFEAGDATVRVFHNNHGFQVSDTVTLSSDSSGISASTTVNGVFGSSFLGARTITAVDGGGYTFEMDSTADSAVFGGGGGILATRQFLMDVVKPVIEVQLPQGTTTNFLGSFSTSKSFAGSETAYAHTENVILQNKTDTHFKQPHVITTSLRETAMGWSSATIDIQGKTVDNYVAPVVDLQRAMLISINNIIDNQSDFATSGFNVPLGWVADSDAQFGSALAKHLTLPITLAEPATGIKVLVDANIPPQASFDLYFRIQETGADGDINDINWVEASKVEPSSNYNNVSPSTDLNLFKEYRFTIGGDYIGALTPFSRYQIKIVMHSTSTTNIPRFKALRTIALGT